jgi:hypothetical protein
LKIDKVVNASRECGALAFNLFWRAAGSLLCGIAFLVYFLRYGKVLFYNEPMVGAINEVPGPPPQSAADIAAEDKLRYG